MTRAEYWSFWLVSVGLGIPLIFLLIINENLIVVAVAYFCAFMVPNISAIVRRVRDTGKPFWWLLVVLIPYIGRYAVWALLFLPSADLGQRQLPAKA